MSAPTFTDNDRKLLAAAWQCFETQPKINYTKLAALMGYKTPASASACLAPVKKKLLTMSPGGECSESPVKKNGKGKSAGKGKGKRLPDLEEGEDDEEIFQGKGGKKMKGTMGGDGEGEGEEAVKVESDGEGEAVEIDD